MILYGTAALALCTLVGGLLGELLGKVMGVDANVGGVGFAMILLVVASGWLRKTGRLPEATEHGLLFWSGMYIPIVVAMAATQNVVAALTGGPMALLAGLAALTAAAMLVPVVSRIGGRSEPLPPLADDTARLETEGA